MIWCACWPAWTRFARFLGAPDGANLLTAYRRAANILRIEEKKGRPSATRGNARTLNLLVEAQEHELSTNA